MAGLEVKILRIGVLFSFCFFALYGVAFAEKDFSALLSEAEQGNPLSQIDVETSYLYGEKGISKDAGQAIVWCGRAATYAEKHPDWPWRSLAFCLLGNAYEASGDATNALHAIEWFRKSALLNDARGMMGLCRIYEGRTSLPGCGPFKNETEALAWVYVDSRSGNPGSQGNRSIELEQAFLEKSIGVDRVLQAKARAEELIAEIKQHVPFPYRAP